MLAASEKCSLVMRGDAVESIAQVYRILGGKHIGILSDCRIMSINKNI